MTDWVELLDAAYAPSADDQRWADDLVAVLPRLPQLGHLELLALRHRADLGSVAMTLASGAHAAATRAALDVLGSVPADVLGRGLRAFFYPPEILCSWRSLATGVRGDDRTVFERFQFSVFAGSSDALGLVMHPAPGVVAVLSAASAERVRLSSRERRSLSQLALHVEAGLRLRLRPASLLGVLSSDGRLLHLEGDAASVPLRTLEHDVRCVERARRPTVRRDPESLDLWRPLTDGRVSLVPRREGTRRQYLLLENPPERQPIRALSKDELDVVSYASRGLPQKMIAYGLGLPAPTVSARLASAASKIGLATRMELVRIAAMLARDPRARFEETALTTAERDVLELVAHGLSNREIARMRGRSIRTIANQVASLLAKTKAPSRRALVAARAPRGSASEAHRRQGLE